MATVEEVYRELNYPSKRKLALDLHARQIPSTGEQLEELTRTSAMRQIFAPPPKYEGKVTSARMNERWQADLANMTSKPGGGGEDHILFVMDIFTRRVWARAMKGSTAITAANAFESILEEAGAKPVELNTDGGGEFSSSFSKMLERQGINHRRKLTPDSRNDLATLDSAIGVIKVGIEKEKTERKENDFTKVLDKVIRGYNASPHSHLDNEAPKDVEGNIGFRFELRRDAAKENQHNVSINTKIQNRLTNEGAFRTLVPGSQFKRRDQPRYSNDVHNVISQVGNVTKDEKGEIHLSKLLLPVPATSQTTETMQFARGGSARIEAAKKQSLQPHADALVARLQELGRSMTTADASKFLRTKPGFNLAIRSVSTFGEFVRLFPTTLTLMTAVRTGGTSRVGLKASERRRLRGKQTERANPPRIRLRFKQPEPAA
jgi:transposase InsO family protein